MPELPELEVIKDMLRLKLVGSRVTGAEVRQPSCLKTVRPLDRLAGAHVRSITRAGKFICIAFDTGLCLCLHLMRNGTLVVEDSSNPLRHGHIFVLRFEPGTDLRLVEQGPRHQAQVHLVERPEDVAWIAEAGIDPLSPEFTMERFRFALGRRNRTVKRFLTDQRALSGIGNAYSDEILFEARLSPFQQTARLKPEETIRLFTAVKKVLRDAILRLKVIDHLPDRRDRTFLRVHGRLELPCPVCGTPVRRVSYQESTIYYCPGCQTGGKVLDDCRMSRLLK